MFSSVLKRSVISLLLRLVVSAAIALAIDTAAHASQATAPTAPVPAAQLPPSQAANSPLKNLDTKNSMNLADTYHKANDELSLQILYIENQRAALEQEKATNQKSNPAAWKSAVNEELKSFCFFQAAGGQPQETEDECYDRWNSVQEEQLLSLRAKLIENKSTASNLEAKRGLGAQAYSPAFKSQAPSAGSRTPYITTPPTLEEVEQEYAQEVTRLTEVTGPQYQQWVEQIPHEPAPADYVKFSKKPQTSSSPTSASEFELDRSCGGQICYDTDAYQKALAEYQKSPNKKYSSREEYLKAEVVGKMEQRGPAGIPGKPFRYQKQMQTTDQQMPGYVGHRTVSAYESAVDAIEKAGQKSKAQEAPKTDIFIVADPESIRIP